TPEHFARPAIHREKLSEVAAGFRMLIIRAGHGTGSAFPHNFVHLSKRCLLAAQTQWYIKGVCLWVVRHGSPALEARSTWTHIDCSSKLRDLPRLVGYLATLRIDLNDRLIAEIGGANELAICTIELPEDSQFSHLEDRLASATSTRTLSKTSSMSCVSPGR